MRKDLQNVLDNDKFECSDPALNMLFSTVSSYLKTQVPNWKGAAREIFDVLNSWVPEDRKGPDWPKNVEAFCRELRVIPTTKNVKKIRRNGQRLMTTHAYVTAASLSQITGLSSRYFQRLAIEKKINWALQPGGPNTAWRFCICGFEEWWKTEGGKQWRGSTKGGKYGGEGSHTKAKNTDNPWILMLKAKLKNVLKDGAKN